MTTLNTRRVIVQFSNQRSNLKGRIQVRLIVVYGRRKRKIQMDALRNEKHFAY